MWLSKSKTVHWNRSKSEIPYSPGIIFTEQGSFEPVRNWSLPLNLDVSQKNQSKDFYLSLRRPEIPELGYNLPTQRSFAPWSDKRCGEYPDSTRNTRADRGICEHLLSE